MVPGSGVVAAATEVPRLAQARMGAYRCCLPTTASTSAGGFGGRGADGGVAGWASRWAGLLGLYLSEQVARDRPADRSDTRLRLFAFGDADDRLAGYPAAGRERGRCLGQRPYGPDDRMQPPGPHPLGEVRQLEPVRLDDKEDRPAVGGLHLRRADDRDQRSAGAHQRDRVFEDLAPDDIEHHVDFAGLLQPVGLQVYEYIRAQAEGGLPVRGATGADHPGAQFVRELHRDRPDAARGAVDQDGLAGL